MPKKIISVGTVVIFVIVFLRVVDAEMLDTYTTIQGITFPSGTEVRFYESGKLYQVILPQDQDIYGIPCARDFPVYFYESGNLGRAVLYQDKEIQGIRFDQGSYLFFYDSGNPGFEATEKDQDREIQDSVEAEGYTSFLEPGMLKIAVPAQRQEVEGILCPAGGAISFYESGKIKQITLGQDEEIEGKLYSKGDTVRFYENGMIAEESE